MPRAQMSPTHVARYKPRVKSPRGTHTELSITVGDPRRGYTNIPTIWRGRRVDPRMAIRFAMLSGIEFPRFRSLKTAVRAAGKRSESIGRAFTRLMQPAGRSPGP